MIRKITTWYVVAYLNLNNWAGEAIEQFENSERGAISVNTLLKAFVAITILSVVIPLLWPRIAESDTEIQAMNGTDEGTEIIQDFWPLGLTLGGIAIGIGAIYIFVRMLKNRGG